MSACTITMKMTQVSIHDIEKALERYYGGETETTTDDEKPNSTGEDSLQAFYDV